MKDRRDDEGGQPRDQQKQQPRLWHERTDLPWIKLWDQWFSSESHIELDATTLGIGACILLLGNRRGRRADGSGWLVGGDGSPLSLKAIAREAHADDVDQVELAIADLVRVGTLEWRGDYLVIPNLQEHQETPQAGRMRKKKTRDLEAQLQRQIDAGFDTGPDAQTSEVQTSEAQTSKRRQTAAAQTVGQQPPSAGRRPTCVFLAFPARDGTWALTQDQVDEWTGRYQNIHAGAVCQMALHWVETEQAPGSRIASKAFPKWLEEKWLREESEKVERQYAEMERKAREEAAG